MMCNMHTITEHTFSGISALCMMHVFLANAPHIGTSFLLIQSEIPNRLDKLAAFPCQHDKLASQDIRARYSSLLQLPMRTIILMHPTNVLFTMHTCWVYEHSNQYRPPSKWGQYMQAPIWNSMSRMKGGDRPTEIAIVQKATSGSLMHNTSNLAWITITQLIHCSDNQC